MISKKTPNTYFFHDYETYGLNTKKTRVSQFAGIRTDQDLNILEDSSFEHFSIPPIDFLPSPEACLVTGITPYSIEQSGKEYLNDYELFSKISDYFNQPGTCSIGYNSINFDDEITRNGFYRNHIPVYTREFKSGCSRFDLLNMLREFAFLYPEDIEIPLDEEGNKIFKLDTLAPLNGFKEDSYHDALTDVRATIFMAKLMKDKQPDYWDFRINLHRKAEMGSYILNNRENILLYTNSVNGGKSDFVEPILITAFSYPDNNSFIGVKLSDLDGLKDIFSADDNKLRERLFMTNEELAEEDLRRLPFVKIASNKATILMNYNDAMSLGVAKINKPLSEINENLKFVQDHIKTFREKSMIAYKNESYQNNEKNPDLKIYGGFMDRQDENLANKFMIDIKNKNYSDYIKNDVFSNDKLNSIARKIIYRNFGDDLMQIEELRPYFITFLKNAYNMVKSEGFSPEFNYSEEEKNNSDYKKNEKMVEFTLNEFREILPSLSEKYKNDETKKCIISDFKSSLNDIMAKYKYYIELSQELDNQKKEVKNSTYKSPSFKR